MELARFLRISSYKYAVPHGTNEFSNSFLEKFELNGQVFFRILAEIVNQLCAFRR